MNEKGRSMSDKFKSELDGKTFIIDIKSMQNSTWQGTILWTQTQQKIPFRSALELIRLLDSAIGKNDEDASKWNLP